MCIMTIWESRVETIQQSILVPTSLVGCGKAVRSLCIPITPARDVGISLFKAAYMAYNYWIKLYHEILDDYKMGLMSDRLWRRTIEMFLLAGDYGRDGELPPLKAMAWRLKLSAEEIEADLVELAKDGIIDNIEGAWCVSKFSARQAPLEPKEKMRRLREKKLKHRRYESVTRGKTESDTESESDTDQIQIIIRGVTTEFEKIKMNKGNIKELISNHDPFYLQEKLREFRFQNNNHKRVDAGWLVRSIKEEWEPPKDYVPDTDNPYVRKKKYGAPQ